MHLLLGFVSWAVFIWKKKRIVPMSLPRKISNDSKINQCLCWVVTMPQTHDSVQTSIFVPKLIPLNLWIPLVRNY